jgi:hypothetical protein
MTSFSAELTVLTGAKATKLVKQSSSLEAKAEAEALSSISTKIYGPTIKGISFFSYS